MMKNKLILITMVLLLISCTNENFKEEFYPNGGLKIRLQINDKGIPNGLFEEYYSSGELKTKGTNLNGKTIDTVYSYYKDGSIKEKGNINGRYKYGWWLYYNDKGNLNKKVEYRKLNDSTIFENQTIHYKEAGEINFDKSWFFEIKLPDTLKLGKNIGELYYYSYSKPDEKYMYVVIENEYENKITKKDTFADDANYTKFGVFAARSGFLNIKGEIYEEELYLKEIEKDSSELIINTHIKYFEKKVYVN